MRIVHAKKMILAVCVGVITFAVTGISAQQRSPKQLARRGPRYIDPIPVSASGQAGWVRMFDGVDLKGWSGPTDLWHVENGAIVVQSKANPPTGPTYLLWEGGQPKNFEMRLEVKLVGKDANSGVQFRAKLLGAVPGDRLSKWQNRGYQADLDNQNVDTGALIECCAFPRRGFPVRHDRAYRGQVVRTALGPGLPPLLLSSFGDPAKLDSVWKVGDWNQLYLVANGRVMIYSINGKLMSVLIDDNPNKFLDHGYIALQLEGRGANKAYFRNIWIKYLPQ